MAKPIPKWVQERLSKLWKKYEGREMSYEQIEAVLKPDEKTTISVFLNELKKAEWIDIRRGEGEEDARIRIYTIKEPNQILKEITSK
ncbi:MAG: hypothetical protein Q8Q31_03935 [Nanoarchaeota archaeon]|nr:hypothetical protein [Nanoarchaeota archaeon]